MRRLAASRRLLQWPGRPGMRHTSCVNHAEYLWGAFASLSRLRCPKCQKWLSEIQKLQVSISLISTEDVLTISFACSVSKRSRGVFRDDLPRRWATAGAFLDAARRLIALFYTRGQLGYNDIVYSQAKNQSLYTGRFLKMIVWSPGGTRERLLPSKNIPCAPP